MLALWITALEYCSLNFARLFRTLVPEECQSTTIMLDDLLREYFVRSIGRRCDRPDDSGGMAWARMGMSMSVCNRQEGYLTVMDEYMSRRCERPVLALLKSILR